MEETTYHLIENYLDGNLAKEELAAFEARLQTDAVFAQRVNLFREIETALGDPVRQNIQAQLDNLGETYFQDPAVAKKKINRLPFYQKLWVIAASFLLLISVGFLFWQNQSIASLSNEQIFAQNYQLPNLDAMTRGTDRKHPLQEVIELYENQDYPTALVRLKELRQGDSENQQLTYLLAHTYLNLSPPQLMESGEIFKTLIQHNQNVYVPKAKWYLALIYIRQNNVVAAQPLLKAVVTVNDSNNEKAKLILRQLDAGR